MALTASASAAAAVLLGNGNGTFQKQVHFATGANPATVAVGDFNGDGRLDVATANSRAPFRFCWKTRLPGPRSPRPV